MAATRRRDPAAADGAAAPAASVAAAAIKTEEVKLKLATAGSDTPHAVEGGGGIGHSNAGTTATVLPGTDFRPPLSEFMDE